MKILELFSGYGTASFALKRLGIPYEIVGYSDIDKYANQCFQQNHGGKELGDVKLINPNELEDFDLLTGGFPCQSFSVAGKGLGEADPRGTLFYEIIRIAEVKKPKYMLLENVKGLTNKKFKDTFNKILSELDRIGYNVYWKVLNSKDYGIPQSRARVWFVCFRKDIDKGTFKFPEPTELKIFIKDILEPQVDSKYYLSPLLQERFRKYLEEKSVVLNPFNKKQSDKISGTLGTSVGGATSKTAQIVAMRGRNPENPSDRTIGIPTEQRLEPKKDGCSNSLTSVQKDNLVYLGYSRDALGNTINLHPKEISNTIKVCQRLNQQGLVFDKAQGKETAEVYEVNPKNDIERPSYLQYQNGHHSELHRIYNSEGISQTIKPTGLKIYDRKGFDSRTKGFRENDLSPTLSTKIGTGGNNIPMVMNTITTAVGRSGHSKEELSWIDTNRQSGQLRRLTPKECFRLMGFLNDEINIEGLSDTQRYKLAGNGQDVNMVSLIFREMFK